MQQQQYSSSAVSTIIPVKKESTQSKREGEGEEEKLWGE